MNVDKIMETSAKWIGKATKSKPLRKLGDKFQENPEKALALTTVASIVVKDGVGCYKYVTQSLNNDKIPDERRGFVAALDLTNGLLMIVAQIAMFAAMRKYSEPIFNKLFKKSFNEKSFSDIATKIRMLAGKDAPRKLNIEKEYKKVRKDALDLFKFVADIAAATIIGKRVIVPFVATPLANVVKDKMEKHGIGVDKKKNTTEKEEKQPDTSVKETETNLEAKIDELEDKFEDFVEDKFEKDDD